MKKSVMVKHEERMEVLKKTVGSLILACTLLALMPRSTLGQTLSGDPNGQGVLVYLNGDRYQGALRDGQPQGRGILTYSDSTTFRSFEGNFRNGKPDGCGTILLINGQSLSAAIRSLSDGEMAVACEKKAIDVPAGTDVFQPPGK